MNSLGFWASCTENFVRRSHDRKIGGNIDIQQKVTTKSQSKKYKLRGNIRFVGFP